jgi:SAM-dependent methyltransferase
MGTRHPAKDVRPDRLTERSYWDSVHEKSAAFGSAESLAEPRRPTGLRRIVPPQVLHWLRDSFIQHDFWNVLLPRYIPKDPAGKVLEIGVAPGLEVLRFHERFGYEPHGIEFSAAGAEATRGNFAARGIGLSNVIEGDFFDEALLTRHEAEFGVVFSRGFVEHFADPAQAIRNHLRLTKPGGLIVISIPRLTGFHYLLARALVPEQIAIHNRGIMWLEPFRKLFEYPDIETLFCGYRGGPNFLISYTPNPAGWRRWLQWCTFKLQILANLAGWIGSGRLLRGSFLNWGLVFIGRRRF